jgi:hypothetical protein
MQYIYRGYRWYLDTLEKESVRINPNSIHSFGYEGRHHWTDLGNWIWTYSITTLIDVREDRTAGGVLWDERGLRQFCDSIHINYLSMPLLAAGLPSRPEDRVALAEAKHLIDSGGIIILVSGERDHLNGPRSRAADRLQAETGLDIAYIQ